MSAPDIPPLTELFSAATAKTYNSFLKDVDIKVALTHPNVIMAMFRERNMNKSQIDNAFKALRSISRLLLKDTTYDSSFIHEQYRMEKKGSKTKDKEDDAVTILSDASDATVNVDKAPCEHCAEMKKLLFYCAMHLMDDAKNHVIQTLLQKCYG